MMKNAANWINENSDAIKGQDWQKHADKSVRDNPGQEIRPNHEAFKNFKPSAGYGSDASGDRPIARTAFPAGEREGLGELSALGASRGAEAPMFSLGTKSSPSVGGGVARKEGQTLVGGAR
jgi:hypothetical protein